MGSSSLAERLHETNGCCIYCGHPISLEEATVDHIVPLSRGGLNEPSNKIASCLGCNSRKANMYPGAFAATLSPRRRKGFENRVTTLQCQRRISKEKAELLLDRPRHLIKAHSLSVSFLGFQLKLSLFIRKKTNKSP